MRISRHKEYIEWIDPDDELPDENILVLIFSPGHADPVGLGCLDKGVWRWECAWRLDHPVVAWAEMPSGPPKREVEE